MNGRIPLAVLFWLTTTSSLFAPPPPPTAKEPSNPFLAWTVKADDGQNAFNAVRVISHLVVGGTDRGECVAIDAKTGKPVWKVTHGKRIYHAPAGDGERVYFTSEQGVTAVKAASGLLDWSFIFPGCDGPVLAKPDLGLVYVGGTDGNLFAIDVRDGNIKWKSDFTADAPKDPPGFDGKSARIDGTSARPNSIAIDGDTIYLTVMDQCRAVAFDARTGEKKASYETKGWTWGAAAVTKDRVFLGSQDGHFYAFDKSTGKEVWKYKTNGRADSGAAVDEDGVYFGSSDGNLYCVNRADGKERWKKPATPAAGRQKGVFSTPLVRKNVVYTASGEGVVYALAAHTGDVIWTLRPADDSDVYHPVVTDGTQFFTVVRPSRVGRGEELKGVSAVVAVGVR